MGEPNQIKWRGIRPTDPPENIPVTESAPLAEIGIKPTDPAQSIPIKTGAEGPIEVEMSQDKIRDADNDTRVETEKNADEDKVRISTAGVERVTISGANIGLGNETPDVRLDVNGYSQLGSDAPKIKMKKLTSTTPAAEGGSIAIQHGVTVGKIISLNCLVWSTATSALPPEYTTFAGYEYSVYIADANDINLNLHATNSENILSKSITITIFYEE